MSTIKRVRKRSDGSRLEAWWVDFVFTHANGRKERFREPSPVNTRKGAEEHERKVRQSLLEGSYGRTGAMLVKDLEEKFLLEAENNNKPSSVDRKKQILSDHILPALGNRPLAAIDRDAIESFKAALKKKTSAARAPKEGASKWAVRKRYGTPPSSLSLKTINNILAVLGRLLNFAVERGYVQSVPKVKLFTTPRPPFDFLHFDEAERLIAAADPEWSACVETALKTGLRQGELIGLEWADIDLVRGTLTVRRAIWQGEIGLPKGGKERLVELPPSLVAVLRRHQRKGARYVFGPGKAPIQPGQMKWPLYRALERAGIARPVGRVGWHDLRHTYASHLAMHGASVKEIQELMGHADLTTTLRYMHLSPSSRRAAAALLDAPAPSFEGFRHGTRAAPASEPLSKSP